MNTIYRNITSRVPLWGTGSESAAGHNRRASLRSVLRGIQAILLVVMLFSGVQFWQLCAIVGEGGSLTQIASATNNDPHDPFPSAWLNPESATASQNVEAPKERAQEVLSEDRGLVVPEVVIGINPQSMEKQEMAKPVLVLSNPQPEVPPKTLANPESMQPRRVQRAEVSNLQVVTKPKKQASSSDAASVVASRPNPAASLVVPTPPSVNKVVSTAAENNVVNPVQPPPLANPPVASLSNTLLDPPSRNMPVTPPVTQIYQSPQIQVPRAKVVEVEATRERKRDSFLRNVVDERDHAPEQGLVVVSPDSERKGYDLADFTKTSRQETRPVLHFYKVKQNDVLSQIAQTFNLSVQDLQQANNLDSPDHLMIGQVLWIPDRPGVYHQVESGETLVSLTLQYKADLSRVLLANGVEASDANRPLKAGTGVFIPLPSSWRAPTRPQQPTQSSQSRLVSSPSQSDWVWPLTGDIRVTSPFGYRTDPLARRSVGPLEARAQNLRMHWGIDLACGIGTPVYAAGNGVVDFAGTRTGYGRCVILKHDNGTTTLYAHLDKILVVKGDIVRQGQNIARSGNTGRTTGPHLHFEIRENGERIDPLKKLPPLQ